MLQGLSRPRRIESQMSYPHAAGAVRNARAAAAIRVSFARAAGLAKLAGALAGTLSPSDWIKLVARLGEIPDPTVATAPSAAAIKVDSGETRNGRNNGNH
jgi:hypothetical protein